MLKMLGRIIYYIRKINNRLVSIYQLSLFKSIGKNSGLSGPGYFSRNIVIGDNVSIGTDSIFLSSNANIIIGNNVMFGPHVIIVTGNHRIDVVGEYMINVREKISENDQDVVIEDDVWIGAGVIILKGVTIGEGSVVGAGSVVTKNIPPYSISVGNKEHKVYQRFNEQQIVEHKSKTN
jgi:acetyltransferase-like isoleucine patch superfamily enzyme